eukprot:403370998
MNSTYPTLPLPYVVQTSLIPIIFENCDISQQIINVPQVTATSTTGFFDDFDQFYIENIMLLDQSKNAQTNKSTSNSRKNSFGMYFMEEKCSASHSDSNFQLNNNETVCLQYAQRSLVDQHQYICQTIVDQSTLQSNDMNQQVNRIADQANSQPRLLNLKPLKEFSEISQKQSSQTQSYSSYNGEENTYMKQQGRSKLTNKSLEKEYDQFKLDKIFNIIKERYSIATENVNSSTKRFSGIQLTPGFRSDVILKTTIRDIRKVYLKQFNKFTKFQKQRRYRDEKFLLFSLQEFAQQKLFSDHFKYRFVEGKYDSVQDSLKDQDSLNLEVMFLLGSMFYPKKMIELTKDEQLSKISENLNSSLYSFSQKKFAFLMQWPAFQLIVLHYSKFHMQNSLQNNKTMSIQPNEYTSALEFMKSNIDKIMIEEHTIQQAQQ